MAELSLKSVSKHFGSVKAVDRVSLHIADGQFVALLGPSGCGKTTTLRLVAGLESADGGEIMIGERDVTTLPSRLRDISMVFQDYALFPHMTVFENVAYQLKVNGADQATQQQRVGEVAQLLQIDHLLQRRPGQLSGGQQQRTALARALVYKPKLYLFDEPLSNLDAKLRLEARAFLKHLQNTLRITSIYVTHDQAEAMALADLVVVMDRGQIAQLGTPLEVYRNPASTFVAGFVGNPPMNLLPCRVDMGIGKLYLATGTLDLPKAPTSDLSRAATVGFRAEKVVLSGAAHGSHAQVYAIQPLGGETLISLQIGTDIITARHFGEDAAELPGEIGVHVAADHLHFFDSAGRRIP